MDSPTVEDQTNSYDFCLPPKVVEQMKEESEKTKRMIEISLKYRKKTISPLQSNKKVKTPALFLKNKHGYNRSATSDENSDAIGKALLAKAQEISKLLKSQIQESIVLSEPIKRSKSRANVFSSTTSSQLSDQTKVSQVLSDRPFAYNNLLANVESERGRLQKSELEQFREKKENLARKVTTSRENGVPTKQLDANLEFRHVQRKNLLLRVQASLDESNIQKILSQNEEDSSKNPKLNSCKASSKKGNKFQFPLEEIQKVKILNEISFPKTKNWDRAGSSNCLEVIKNSHVPEKSELDQCENFRFPYNASQPSIKAQRSVLSPEGCESLSGSVTTFKISDILNEKKRTLFRSQTHMIQQKLGKVVLSQRPIKEKEVEAERSLEEECSIEMQSNLDRKFTTPVHIQSMGYLDEKPLLKKASRQISFNDDQYKPKQSEDFRIKLLSNKKKAFEGAPSCPTLSSLTHLQDVSEKIYPSKNGNSELQDKYNKIWNTSIEAGKQSRKTKRKRIAFNVAKSIPVETFESINGIVFGKQNLEEGYDLLMKLDRERAEPTIGKNVRIFTHKSSVNSVPEISSSKHLEVSKAL